MIARRTPFCLTLLGALIFICLGTPEALSAQDGFSLQTVDENYERAVAENYNPVGQTLMATNLADCQSLLDRAPTEFEFLWRAARSAVALAECSKILETQDWKKQCQVMGSHALDWSESAIREAPKRIEGYFWNLRAAGLVYDAEGAIAFMSKGLPGKVRRDLDSCESIDLSYLDYVVLLARAKYYYELPALLGQDLSKARALCDRFLSLTRWSYEPYRQLPEAAEILLSSRAPQDIAEAGELLRQALADPTPRPYYYDFAVNLMKKQ